MTKDKVILNPGHYRENITIEELMNEAKRLLIEQNRKAENELNKRISIFTWGLLIYGTIGLGLSILFDGSFFTTCMYLVNLLLGFSGIKEN